jgi:surfeit locus 1 family protein
MRHMKPGIIAAIIFGIAGVAVLVGLGVWQVKRLTWKEAIIARLEQRLATAPVALPTPLDPLRDDFLRVRVTGKIGEDALHVLTSLKPWGPGFRIIAPLTDADGQVVLVDLGYVPEAMKGEAIRFEGAIEVVGALYWPNETDGFTPPPDHAANIWFARDLAPMAEALGTSPVLVIAESHGVSFTGGDWPKPLRLGINLPNDHLQYAITWFSLALIWAVMSTMLVHRERQRLGKA